MFVYYIMMAASPMSDNPESEKFGGAYVNCWVKALNRKKAISVAEEHINSEQWIVDAVEEVRIVQRGAYLDDAESLECYDYAWENGLSSCFYTWPLEESELGNIYDRLSDKYEIVLTNAFSLENGKEDWGEDIELLRGESSAGKFTLFDAGQGLQFDVDKPDGTYTHWHPAGVEEAINDVILFMQGICRR